MDSGLYAAYTGLLARTQALDTAANNLANAGTAGFRAEKDFFRGVMVDNLSGLTSDSQVGSTVNDYGILGGNMLDFTQGQIATTGNPLDLALEGDGFFAVQTGQTVQAGINGQPDQIVPLLKYTRQGNFSRSATGLLEDSEGHPVLDTQQRPIVIPTGDIQVSSSGTVSIATPAGSTVVGQLGVFTFPDKRILTADGTNRLSAPGTAKPVAGTATIRQGALEGSNEDAIQGTMQLVLVQRQTEMMQKALSVFNTDFDKVATEELPKV
jgi:flagellar basal-body rod protein FlgF/flagellar basal-body rod protein FlgG